ncbi:transcription factor FSS1 [Fusarium albosuccineum]|uniref:Transcription factor FSS1 n=1 Tax=Fusarium albosuccineum TaxID=1237068 RepID=A0A8H4LEC4_9HYPO|nr:transcription factor FSS1 [Fusarium albosuccineum]
MTLGSAISSATNASHPAYAVRSNSRPNSREIGKQRTQALSNGLIRAVVRPLLPLPIGAPSIPTERDLLYHVRTCTLHDLVSTSNSIGFWQSHALPLSHAVEPVKFALCALGGAHRQFKAQRGGEPMSHDFESIAIQQYNQAISCISICLMSPSEKNMEVTLTCCIIFICIENLFGRYTKAVGYLRSAYALFKHVQESTPLLQSSTQESPTSNTALSGVFTSIADILFRLNIDVAFYIGSDACPDAIPPHVKDIEMEFPARPFASYVDAEASFNLMKRVGNARWYLKSQGRLMHEWDRFRPETTIYDTSLVPHELAFLAPYFLHWNARFDLFKQQADRSSATHNALRRIATLELYQSVWLALLKCRTLETDFSPSDCSAIMDCAEALLRLEPSETSPAFAFDGVIVPAVCLTLHYCEDEATQRRGINLLRTIRRREGVWDSQEMSDVFEAMVTARRKDLIAWDAIPYNIPSIAKRLSGLNMPDLRFPQELLLLGAEMAD